MKVFHRHNHNLVTIIRIFFVIVMIIVNSCGVVFITLQYAFFVSLCLFCLLPQPCLLSTLKFTCGIVHIRLSNGVDKSGVEGVVDEGGVGVGNVGGGVGQSIPVFTHENT